MQIMRTYNRHLDFGGENGKRVSQLSSSFQLDKNCQSIKSCYFELPPTLANTSNKTHATKRSLVFCRPSKNNLFTFLKDTFPLHGVNIYRLVKSHCDPILVVFLCVVTLAQVFRRKQWNIGPSVPSQIFGVRLQQMPQ